MRTPRGGGVTAAKRGARFVARQPERPRGRADSRARGGFASQPHEASRTQPVAYAEARLGSRFARRVRFPMGREPPQGAVMAEHGSRALRPDTAATSAIFQRIKIAPCLTLYHSPLELTIGIGNTGYWQHSPPPYGNTTSTISGNGGILVRPKFHRFIFTRKKKSTRWEQRAALRCLTAKPLRP